MPITYGDVSTSRQRDFTASSVKVIEISNITEGAVFNAPLLIEYILESDVGTGATIDFEFSTNGGASFADATAQTSHSSHSGTSGLTADADTEKFTFVWDVETDLGATFNSTTVVVRVRATDGSAFSDYVTSPQFAVSLIPTVSITSPQPNSLNGTPILIGYTITNNRAVTGTYSLTAQYSTDGASYNTATPDTSHSSHSGITGLSAGAKTFVWNSVANVTASFNNTVFFRLRVNDGSNNSAYATISFRIDLTPTVEILTPLSTSEESTPVLVTYNLTSNFSQLSTFAITAEYSTNVSSPSYSAMVADTSNSSHSGVSSLSAGTKTFVWTPIPSVGSIFAGDVIIRITATDGTNTVSDTQTFRVDVLPRTPTLVSPIDTYFDAGSDLSFIWEVPTDPGGENLIQRIEVDNDSTFASPNVDDDSNAPTAGRFQHIINATTESGIKSGFNGVSFFYKDIDVTSTSGTTFTYGGVADNFGQVPFIYPDSQFLILNKSDRMAYVDKSSISGGMSVILKKSVVGIDANAKVDLMMFIDSSSPEIHWVDVTMSSDTVNYTLGTSPLATDIEGANIPSSITNLHVDILPVDDRFVYVTNRSNTGFTLKRSAFTTSSSSTNTPVRLCLRKDPSKVYQHRDLTASSLIDTSIDFDSALDDETNGSVDWPNYIGGNILNAVPTSDRMSVISKVENDNLIIRKSRFGIGTTAQATLHAGARDASLLPYYTDVSTLGIPDKYEGINCKYTLNSALSTGSYFWRVRAGTLT